MMSVKRPLQMFRTGQVISGGGWHMVTTYPLLQKTTHQTPGLFWKIFKRRGCGIAIQTTHGNAEKGAAGQELAVCVAESCALNLRCLVSATWIPNEPRL